MRNQRNPWPENAEGLPSKTGNNPQFQSWEGKEQDASVLTAQKFGLIACWAQ